MSEPILNEIVEELQAIRELLADIKAILQKRSLTTGGNCNETKISGSHPRKSRSS